MEQFTAFQYIKLDIANSFGLDKELFTSRLNWFEDNKENLSSMVDAADEPAQFYAGMLAYQDTMERKPTGYLVGMDATASGLQCMAALTGCKVTAESVNLVDPNVRKDVYTDGYRVMGELLQGKLDKIQRADTKDATMTHFYGSSANPKKLFGDGTHELQMFYQMVDIIAPGANLLRQNLIDLWQANALQHAWTLPDGFRAVVKVMTMMEDSFEVNELKSSFTHRYYVHRGSEFGLSLAANVIHSVDGFVVRELARRCNYNKEVIERLYKLLVSRNTVVGTLPNVEKNNRLKRLIGITTKTQFVSAVYAEYITEENVMAIPLWIRDSLVRIFAGMLSHKPFAVISIHDAFKCHALYMNHVRQYYIDIFAEMADSLMLQAMVSDITGRHTPVHKLSNDLSGLIRQSNYMLS